MYTLLLSVDNTPLLVLLERLLHLETTIFHFSHLLTIEIHVSIQTGLIHTENEEVNIEESNGLGFLLQKNTFYNAITEHYFIDSFDKKTLFSTEFITG